MCARTSGTHGPEAEGLPGRGIASASKRILTSGVNHLTAKTRHSPGIPWIRCIPVDTNVLLKNTTGSCLGIPEDHRDCTRPFTLVMKWTRSWILGCGIEDAIPFSRASSRREHYLPNLRSVDTNGGTNTSNFSVTSVHVMMITTITMTATTTIKRGLAMT